MTKFLRQKKSAKGSNNKAAVSSLFPSSRLRDLCLAAFVILAILSMLDISLNSDDLSNGKWSLLINFKVTSTTLIFSLFLTLLTVTPWIIANVPYVNNSLSWLREQGVEEIETNLLRIKLRYGLQEASENYLANIESPELSDTKRTLENDQYRIEKLYRNAISLIDTEKNIDPLDALDLIDKLAIYYDRLRQEMPSGHKRNQLMGEITSTMWTLVPKTSDFPVWERLNSPKAGERLSAYKYLEWQPSTEYTDLLVSRAVGILEVPFGQFAALLALRRFLATGELDSVKSKEIKTILNWTSKLPYMERDVYRHKFMQEVASLIGENA